MDFLPPDIVSSLCLLAGLLVDFVFGDPPRLPNPVRLFGAVISRADSVLNTGRAAAVKGAVFSVSLVVCVFAGFTLLEAAALFSGALVHAVFCALFVFLGLAGKSLTTGCGGVFSALESGDIEAARARLSHLVGRDTAALGPRRIKTAALETMSENLSDGVVAPLFFYMLGGIPAMMAYKAVNTLDSMIGYKTARHLRFGMAAARMDDLANLVPARLTAAFMVLCAPDRAGMRRAFAFTRRFGRSHPSPNAGFPQAALAGILDCRFGGASSYGGRTAARPFIGLRDREPDSADFKKAAAVGKAATVCAAAFAVAAALVF
ncbi:MAG: adenosylcobinamide-phosphate synthase CbiB [Candidatus Dadabacteria bacterium]|nr:adenosylcobinamide-phosphate synthase CbiB [Candidatus Dadabacteria bacterium]